MTTLVAPDVSEFQKIVTDAFGRRSLIMRAAFGAHYQDGHFLANAAGAKWLYDRGHIDGVILYTVYLSSATPQEQYAYLWKLIGPTVPPWLMGIMIDVEHWGGTSYSISGDHSKQINTLYGLHAHKMGHWSAVIGYGNKYDLASIWPHRDTRCAVIEAKYGSSLKADVANCIGIQYTDGTSRWPTPLVAGQALPRSSTPFGTCDHNAFPAFASAKALRARMRPPAATPVPAPAKPPAPATTPAPHYAAPLPGGTNMLISKNREWASFLMDDGRIDVRHNGVHHHYLPSAA